MANDAELIFRFTKKASQEAFNELVQSHINFVYATALRLAGSDARAKEVTQEVFIQLAKKAPRLKDRNNIVGWLHTSVRYAAASLRRSEARREAREQKAQAMHEVTQASTESFDWEKISPILDEALSELNAADRDAILLRYFKQRSFGEIGAMLGLSEEAARKRIDRGVDKLRSVLAKRGITSTLAALEIGMASQGAVAAPAGLATAVATASLATGVTTTAPSLVSIISLSKIASVAAAFALGSFAGRLPGPSQTSNSGHTSTNFHQQALAREGEDLRKRITAVRAENAEQQLQVASLKTKLAQRIQTISPTLNGGRFVDFILSGAEDPEVQNFLKEMWRSLAVTGFSYDHLFAKLNFSAAQIDQFLEIELNHSPMALHHKFTSSADGHGEYNFTFSRQAEPKANPEMQEFLGEAAYKVYEANKKSGMINLLVVDRLAASLIYTDSPLNSSTAEKLTETIRAAAEDPDQPHPINADWDKILKQSKGFLTPVQWANLARLSGNLSESYSHDF